MPDHVDEIVRRAADAGVPASTLGESSGDRLVVEGLVDVSLPDARDRWQSAVPEAVAP
jgi:hypothetical protein